MNISGLLRAGSADRPPSSTFRFDLGQFAPHPLKHRVINESRDGICDGDARAYVDFGFRAISKRTFHPTPIHMSIDLHDFIRDARPKRDRLLVVSARFIRLGLPQ